MGSEKRVPVSEDTHQRLDLWRAGQDGIDTFDEAINELIDFYERIDIDWEALEEGKLPGEMDGISLPPTEDTDE